jgi:CubicO group peptidase (beta-lactamase class C family)
MDGERLERITEHFERRYIATGKLPGCQVTVARGQNVGYFRSFGTLDGERHERV